MVLSVAKSYYTWLHGRWPQGNVEKLPVVNENGETNVSGLFVVGDLTGIPLLKFSADTGTKAIRHIHADSAFQNERNKGGDDVVDVAIVGSGVSGLAAALEAKKLGLKVEWFEAAEPFSTVANFPKGKYIFTYPTDMTPAGDVQFGEETEVKEGLVAYLRRTLDEAGVEPTIARVSDVKKSSGTFEVSLADHADKKSIRARRVIVAIGRSGNFRKLNVPGEDKDKVSNRLHDPKDFGGKNCLVVGGGDSAVETAIALTRCGANVTFVYRKKELTRPKPENVEKLHALAADSSQDIGVVTPVSERVTTSAGAFMNIPPGAGTLKLMLGADPKQIDDDTVTVTQDGEETTLENDNVFTMIGREPPLDFFRRAGVHIQGELRPSAYATMALSILVFTFLYHWKKTGVWLPIGDTFAQNGWFPYNVPNWWTSLGSAFADPSTFVGTLKISLGEPGFYYSALYCSAIVYFGIRRIRRRKTPYIKAQTTSLMAFQLIPLFFIPYILLPYLGNNGVFDAGLMKTVADEFLPIVNYGHGREYWRAFGFILAWPLFIWNVFTDQPMWGWLIVSCLQTFVVIPVLIYFFGKGIYCGWICSCGALAETMGDTHRHKMPHGPKASRFNMIGQFFLAVAFFLLFTKIGAWVFPGSILGDIHYQVLKGIPVLNYNWTVDLLFAGILGVAFYWHFSGRIWCRFACPLAALMHIYARFSSFRIISEKKKCISCNMCTSVCHQGIDIMNFANKGQPMEDPECVRCSACVQSCPTGVLSFGRVDRKSGNVIAQDKLIASPVQLVELKRNR